jgi:hypothetical protein
MPKARRRASPRVTCPRFRRRAAPIKSRALAVMWQRPKLHAAHLHMPQAFLQGKYQTTGASQVPSSAKWARWARTNTPDLIRWGSRRCLQLAHFSCLGIHSATKQQAIHPARFPYKDPDLRIFLRNLPSLDSPSLLSIHYCIRINSSCRRMSSLLARAVSTALGSCTVLRIANDVDSVWLERCSHHLLGWRQCRSP